MAEENLAKDIKPIVQNRTKKRRGLRGKKKLMVEVMTKKLGNVSASTKAVGIGRTTHYDWLESDEVYRKAIEEMPERVLDFVEGRLMKNVDVGNVTAQIFYLKTKGKKRGYIERQEIEQVGDTVQKFQLIDINSKEDLKKLDDDSKDTPNKDS